VTNLDSSRGRPLGGQPNERASGDDSLRRLRLFCLFALMLAPAAAHAREARGLVGDGTILCFAGSERWLTAAESIQIHGQRRAIRYVESGTGETIESTAPCLANLGAVEVILPSASGPANVECRTPMGEHVTAQMASVAEIVHGVTVWRNEETGEVFLSTLDCRIRRVGS
jgi:hypothetical protein